MTSVYEVNYIAEISPPVSFRNYLSMPSLKKVTAGILVILALIAAFICGFILFKNTDIKSNNDTPFADFLFHNMNLSIDPCMDFYQFTCGLWSSHLNSSTGSSEINEFRLLNYEVNKEKRNIFLNSKPNSKFPTLVNDAIEFYSHCTNLNRNNKSDTEFLLKIFNDLGGWPMLHHASWNESSFDLIKANLYLHKKLDIAAYFEIAVTINDFDPESKIISILVPSIVKNNLMLNDYFTQLFLYSTLQTINPDYDDDYFEEDIRNLLIVEKKWKELISDSERFEATEPIQISFKELQKRLPNFDWLEYIKNFFNDTEKRFTGDSILMVEDIDYLDKVISILKSDTFSKRDIANFFGWLVVKNTLILIPNVLKLYANINEYNELDTRTVCEEKCYVKTIELYECSIDYLYVQKSSEKGVVDSTILVKYLKDALRDIFSSSKWLEDSTKYAAIQKLNAMKTVLGYKDYHKNKSELEKLYKDFPRVNENVLQTYYKIKLFNVEKKRKYFKYKEIDEDLPKPITDISAYYILKSNSLVIPIPLFSPPFYYSNGPNYLNFGAIGSIIGHEIMHAFDKQGCLRNEYGSKVNWWTANSLEKFNEHVKCFENQYDSYYSSRNLSATNLTPNENIADSEGLRLAYAAFKLWLKDNADKWNYPLKATHSPEQMFFISFGSVWCSTNHSAHNSNDDHSSPDFRVNGAVSNSEQFEQAFQCAKNCAMNPENKCKLW